MKRFPDPPVFSETNEDVTLDDWVQSIKDKLRLNGDDIGDNLDRATYVISRTRGTAARHILAYRINDDNYFKTPKQVISTLHEIMGDPNRRNVMRHSFKTLRQKNCEAFFDFFSNFRIHSTYLHLSDRAAMEEFMDKLNIRMQKGVATKIDKFRTLNELLNFCQKFDFALRNISEKKDRYTAASVRAVSCEKAPPVQTTTQHMQKTTGYASPVYVSPARQATSEPTALQRPVRPTSPYTCCYTCNKEGHYQSDCPEKKREVVRELSDTSDNEETAWVV